MTNEKTFLGTEPVGKLLFKLAVPAVVAQLVNMLYNIVDRIYIGHIPGSGNSGKGAYRTVERRSGQIRCSSFFFAS